MSAISAAPTHGLHDHRRRGEPRGAAAVGGRGRGRIVLSYETYALVRQLIAAAAADADHHEGHQPRGGCPMRWSARGLRRSRFRRRQRRATGLSLYLDPAQSTARRGREDQGNARPGAGSAGAGAGTGEAGISSSNETAARWAAVENQPYARFRRPAGLRRDVIGFDTLAG